MAVCRLKRAVSKMWGRKIDKSFCGLHWDFIQGKETRVLFVKRAGNEIILVILYVEDAN